MDVWRWPLLLAFGASVLCSGPVMAQDAADDTKLPEPEKKEPDPVEAKVKLLIRNADELTGKEERSKRCQPSAANKDIVVCGETDPDAKFRVPPDTEGRLATGGPPPAPDVAGDGIFKGKATVSGCLIPPCPPPAAYFIDYSKLPDVDEAYLKKAREAEAEERRREAAKKDEAQKDGGSKP